MVDDCGEKAKVLAQYLEAVEQGLAVFLCGKPPNKVFTKYKIEVNDLMGIFQTMDFPVNVSTKI